MYVFVISADSLRVISENVFSVMFFKCEFRQVLKQQRRSLERDAPVGEYFCRFQHDQSLNQLHRSQHVCDDFKSVRM